MVTSVSQAMHMEKTGRMGVKVANPGNTSKSRNEMFHTHQGVKNKSSEIISVG